MTERPEQEEQEVAAALERVAQTRRNFLKTVGTAAAGGAALGTAACGDNDAWEAYFQSHYLQLSEADKERIFARLEQQTRDRYGVDVHIADPKPLDGVEYAYALNLTYCIGCRRCEFACARENNTSRDPEIHYIRVMEMEKGSLDVEQSEHYYEGQVPREGSFYMPVQCHQCENPPCVRACPVQATWREPDGIVVVDYNWCIGCRYCEAACPYWARRFNFAEPGIRASEINPHQSYLSNRLRPIGVVEKCTYCLHRTREGRYPACLEVCPTGARKFGNVLDQGSEVRRIIETKRVYVFKEDLGTYPRFYYFFD